MSSYLLDTTLIRAQEDNLFDRTDVEAWQHVELTVTNCSFGLTIKFTVHTSHTTSLTCGFINPVSIQFLRSPQALQLLGDPSERVPPVPIPNTEVKPLSPDGTACASVWESRTSPGLF